MKKIFSILLLAFFVGGNFLQAQTDRTSFGGTTTTDPNLTNQGLNPPIVTTDGGTTTPTDNTNTDGGTVVGVVCGSVVCAASQVCYQNLCMSEQEKLNKEKCNGGVYDTVAQECLATPLADDQTVMGMTIGQKCLLNGQCKFNIYDALGIRTSVRNPGVDGQPGDPTSVGIFVQDIVLSATMFIGTIVTIAIIVSGLMRIFAGASGKDPTKAKSGLINALIGLLIVVSSYLIIRLVQYIAKGF